MWLLASCVAMGRRDTGGAEGRRRTPLGLLVAKVTLRSVATALLVTHRALGYCAQTGAGDMAVRGGRCQRGSKWRWTGQGE